MDLWMTSAQQLVQLEDEDLRLGNELSPALAGVKLPVRQQIRADAIVARRVELSEKMRIIRMSFNHDVLGLLEYKKLRPSTPGCYVERTKDSPLYRRGSK